VSALSERSIEVPSVALDTEDRSPIGTGMALMLIVSLLFWGTAALIWFER
jgi:hypothetical protein